MRLSVCMIATAICNAGAADPSSLTSSSAAALSAATDVAPSNQVVDSKLFLRANDAKITFLGRVDQRDLSNVRMAWVMTGASATLSLNGPPMMSAVSASASVEEAADAYGCAKNHNYEGETVSWINLTCDNIYVIQLDT